MPANNCNTYKLQVGAKKNAGRTERALMLQRVLKINKINIGKCLFWQIGLIPPFNVLLVLT